MATVKTASKNFPIPDSWVALADDSQASKDQRDALIRHKLVGYVPSITNAQLSYAPEGEEMVVRVTTQLGSKALDDFEDGDGASLLVLSRMHCDLRDIHQTLRDAPSYVSHAHTLSWRLKWMQLTGELTLQRLVEMQPEIREALETRDSSNVVGHIHHCLKELPAAPISVAPLGF